MEEYTGQTLRSRRLEALLTQQELAQAIGVSRLSVIKWEHGEQNPSLKHIRVLKRVLGGQKKTPSIPA